MIEPWQHQNLWYFQVFSDITSRQEFQQTEYSVNALNRSYSEITLRVKHILQCHSSSGPLSFHTCRLALLLISAPRRSPPEIKAIRHLISQSRACLVFASTTYWVCALISRRMQLCQMWGYGNTRLSLDARFDFLARVMLISSIRRLLHCDVSLVFASLYLGGVSAKYKDANTNETSLYEEYSRLNPCPNPKGIKPCVGSNIMDNTQIVSGYYSVYAIYYWYFSSPQHTVQHRVHMHSSTCIYQFYTWGPVVPFYP